MFNNKKFKKIRVLDLSQNKISIIEPGALVGLDNLETLLLGNNLLLSTQPGAFKGGPKKLNELWVYGNPGAATVAEQASKELPGTRITTTKFTDHGVHRTLSAVASALAVAYIAGGAVALSTIESTEGRRAQPYRLRSIAEYGTGELEAMLAEEMTMGPRLDQAAKRLDLSHLGLTSLEGLKDIKTVDGVEIMGDIETLFLDHNELTALPESFGDFTHLKVLYLNQNRLTELPESFGQLTRLTYLDLSLNRISELPESFSRLTNLNSLFLYGNPLSEAERLRLVNRENIPQGCMVRIDREPVAAAGRQKTTHVAQKSARKKKDGVKVARHGKKEKAVAA